MLVMSAWLAASSPVSENAAWITAIAGVTVALITGIATWGVPAWKVRREARLDTGRALRHTRDPLLRAAFDLQSRLYNIVAKDFLERYLRNGSPDERQYAVMSTLWVIGQYMGWVEILRREVQYLDLGSRAVNRRLQLRLSDIATAFATDADRQENAFMLFRADQRALGEFMVTSRDTASGEKRPDCLGYSEFVARLHAAASHAARQAPALPRPPIVGWVERCEEDLRRAAGAPENAIRLAKVQRRLIDLVDLLDPDRVRYPEVNFRGRLPLTSSTGVRPKSRIARFLWRVEPWPTLEQWAATERFQVDLESPSGRSYRGPRGPTFSSPQVVVRYEDGWVTLDGAMLRGSKLSPISGALRDTRGRAAVNELLAAFDRPTITDGSTLPSRAWKSARRIVRRLGNGEDERP